jgi:hypothetical protein
MLAQAFLMMIFFQKRTPQYKSRFSLKIDWKTAFILRGPIFEKPKSNPFQNLFTNCIRA